jgi:putative transcriptional regulator
MELTQRALAGIIGAEEQTLRLWEKNRDKFMPATAERLLRALYSEALVHRFVETPHMGRIHFC